MPIDEYQYSFESQRLLFQMPYSLSLKHALLLHVWHVYVHL